VISRLIFILFTAASISAQITVSSPGRAFLQLDTDTVQAPLPRQAHSKTISGVQQEPPRFSDRQIVLKFQDESGIGVQRGELAVSSAIAQSSDYAERLAAVHLTPQQVETEVSRIRTLLRDSAEMQVLPLIGGLSEKRLELLQKAAQRHSKKQLADLRTYFEIRLAEPNAALVRQIVERLSRFNAVETVYALPVPVNAQDISPTTTLDLRPSQGYSGPAPNGIDVPFARTLPGGSGEGINVVDVEFAWDFDHEDLPHHPVIQEGLGIAPVSEWNDHGTAVLGVVVGAVNSFGVTGVAPAANYGTSSAIGPDFFGRGLAIYNVSNAVLVAASRMNPGDVMLIEQHFPGPSSGQTCPCNCDQFEYVAMEYFPDVYDAISLATSLGIVVVEAAGNGSMNLNAACYEHRFDRSFRDSGAILVGAGSASNRSPRCFSNFGSRLDVQGWGNRVATLGYGDAGMRINADDSRQWYTGTFSGTSSATPIVAGAAVLVQSTRKARGLPLLSSEGVRDVLSSSGTPQGAGGNIGPLPNLAAALPGALPDDASFAGVDFDGPLIASTTVTASVRWRNSGSFPWSGGSYLSRLVASFGEVSSGTPNLNIAPGTVATIPVVIHLPTTPKVYDFRFEMIHPNGVIISQSNQMGLRVRLGGVSTQDNAVLSDLEISNHVTYHVDDDFHSAHLTMRNTGSRDWTANSGFRLVLHSPSAPGGQPSNVVSNTINVGQTVQFSFHFACGGNGTRTVSMRMENPEGQPFGNSLSKTITCQRVAGGHQPD
jgi:serine protease